MESSRRRAEGPGPGRTWIGSLREPDEEQEQGDLGYQSDQDRRCDNAPARRQPTEDDKARQQAGIFGMRPGQDGVEPPRPFIGTQVEIPRAVGPDRPGVPTPGRGPDADVKPVNEPDAEDGGEAGGASPTRPLGASGSRVVLPGFPVLASVGSPTLRGRAPTRARRPNLGSREECDHPERGHPGERRPGHQPRPRRRVVGTECQCDRSDARQIP